MNKLRAALNIETLVKPEDILSLEKDLIDEENNSE